MSAELPDVDGLWIDREDMVWAREGHRIRCIQSPGEGYDLREEDVREDLAEWAPYRQLLPLASDELAMLRQHATRERDRLRSLAAHLQAHAAPQAQITAHLIAADLWRAIAEKTGAS